jgi:hypothetical protein
MDAGAALTPSEIEVRLGEWIYTIPALPASAWVEALLDEEGGAIVPGLMDPATRTDVWRQFLLGHITKEELDEAWRSAVGAASGQPWWQCARLIMSAAHQDAWPIVHGKLIMRGLRLEEISLGALYNALYFLLLEACKDDNDRASFEFNLTSPPPEVTVEEALAETNAEEDYMSALRGFQQVTGG